MGGSDERDQGMGCAISKYECNSSSKHLSTQASKRLNAQTPKHANSTYKSLSTQVYKEEVDGCRTYHPGAGTAHVNQVRTFVPADGTTDKRLRGASSVLRKPCIAQAVYCASRVLRNKVLYLTMMSCSA
jgi:hypothetical protein